MSLEQYIPSLFGSKHGYVRKLDIKAFEQKLKLLNFFDSYFDVSFQNIENIPAEGKGLLVGNHGPGGIDAPFLIKHVYEERNRVVRGLADRALFKVPLGRVLVAQLGIVEGERQQAIDMLNDDCLLSAYPGGMRETVKAPEQKYQLRPFWEKSDGFVKVCLETGAPIIPIACVGIDEIFSQLLTSEAMKNTPPMKIWQWMMDSDKYTLPLYYGRGLFPHKIKLTYLVGKPIPMQHSAKSVNDAKVLALYKEKTIVAIEDLLDKGLAERHIPTHNRRSSPKLVSKIEKQEGLNKLKLVNKRQIINKQTTSKKPKAKKAVLKKVK